MSGNGPLQTFEALRSMSAVIELAAIQRLAHRRSKLACVFAKTVTAYEVRVQQLVMFHISR